MFRQWVTLLKILLLLSACSHGQKHDKGPAPVYYGLAELRPLKDSSAIGRLKFSEAFSKVEIEGEIRDLPPDGKFGFHIHEFGDCSAVDGSSAGSHYAKQGSVHGAPGEETSHIGDLGNITSDKKGVAKIKVEVSNMSVSSGMNPIIGRSVVVHIQPDDLVSQPSGGAGARIACGVIGASGK